MTTLHVIFDPDDKVTHAPDLYKQIGISIAVLTIHEDDWVSIEATAQKLAKLLLEQVHPWKPL